MGQGVNSVANRKSSYSTSLHANAISQGGGRAIITCTYGEVSPIFLGQNVAKSDIDNNGINSQLVKHSSFTFVYILAVTEEQLSSVTLSIFWRHCGAAAFVYILAVTEEQLSSVALSIFWLCCGAAALSTFWLLRRSICPPRLCLYSGCYGGAAVFRDFVYILASLWGSSPVYILAAAEEFHLQRICLHSDVAAWQKPLSIFWLLRRSSCLL